MADLIASSEGSKQKIQMGSRISLHFALLMPGGEEIDTTRRGKPAALTLGDGNLLPGFESALLGLSAGDDAQLIVPAEQAFGERVEANVRLTTTVLTITARGPTVRRFGLRRSVNTLRHIANDPRLFGCRLFFAHYLDDSLHILVYRAFIP